MRTKTVYTMLSLSVIMVVTFCENEKKSYSSNDDYPAFYGADLGLTYSPGSSQFKLWSPAAKKVVIHLSEKGEGGNRKETVPMSSAKDGLWEGVVRKDLQGLFYTFQVETENAERSSY